MELRIRNIDPELHIELKVICVREGVSVESKVREIIEAYVHANMKGSKDRK